MKKIMILGASVLQLPAIKKANELGLQVIVVDQNRDAVGFKEKYVINEVVSTLDTEKIMKIAKKHDINGITTLASDMPMRTVAYVAHDLGLVGVSKETAINTTNKVAMRECLEKKGIPIPKFYNINEKSDFFEALKNFSECCIIKPADNSGSRGISLITDLQNSDVAEKAFDYSKQYSRSGEILVEEYMDGSEVSVETLSIEGVCHIIQITDKLTTGEPYFVEMGHSEPSLLPFEIKEEVSVIAVATVNAVGIKNGPAHVEVKITKDGPKIVEVGARLGGDNITSHLVPLSTGIDMVESCIRIAMGEKPEINKELNRGSAIRYIKTKSEGRIKKISGIEEAKNIFGVKEVCLSFCENDNVSEVKNSNDRIGFVLAEGVDVKEAIVICDEALSYIKILIGD